MGEKIKKKGFTVIKNVPTTNRILKAIYHYSKNSVCSVMLLHNPSNSPNAAPSPTREHGEKRVATVKKNTPWPESSVG